MIAPPELKLVSSREQRIEVTPAVCQRLGVESVWARPGLDPRAAVLLQELQSERCGHSWRSRACNLSKKLSSCCNRRPRCC